MKNWKVVVFVVVFGIALFGCNGNGSGGVYAQSSNNEQRLIGTWVNINNNNSTIVFNSNGTITWDTTDYKYGAAANKLVLYSSNNSNNYSNEYYDFFISTDGKMLIIIGNNNNALVFRKNT